MGERRDIEFVARSLLRSDLEKFQSSHCGSARRGLKDQILSQSCSRYTVSISSPVPVFVPRKPFQTPKVQKQTPPSQPRHSGVTATREAQKAASSKQPTSAAPIRFHHGFLVPGSCGCTKQAKGQRRVPDSYFCRLFAAGGFFLFLFLFLLNQGTSARALRAWGTVVQDPDGALQLSLRKGRLSTQARSSTAGVVTPGAHAEGSLASS